MLHASLKKKQSKSNGDTANTRLGQMIILQSFYSKLTYGIKSKLMYGKMTATQMTLLWTTLTLLHSELPNLH